jgi:histidyl-tRNA synthetase
MERAVSEKSGSPLQPPRGTRDFYPEDLRFREWLFEHFRAVSRAFGFEGVDAPVLEFEELFTRKAGEEITDQLFHFELHERRYALRPEFTPSLARMVMARAGSLRLPLRWTTIAQCWRYERMTRGRRREHYQWNMDIWGEPSVTAEAELIAAVFALVDRLGLARRALRVGISSRALLEETLRAGALRERPEAFPALCVAIDKLDKIGRDAVIDQLADANGPVALSRAAAGEVVDWLAVRDVQTAAAGLPQGSPAHADLLRLFELLDAYGVRDRVEFDASIVRGLAYYTGVVFEAFDASRKLRAIAGGGRYDRLLEMLGGPAMPAVGFGFGDAVIEALLEDEGVRPSVPRALDAVVFPFGDAERPTAIRLAQRLRAEGASAELVLGAMKLKRALADADRAGARRIYLVGPEELARGVVLVRDLATGEQSEEPAPGAAS